MMTTLPIYENLVKKSGITSREISREFIFYIFSLFCWGNCIVAQGTAEGNKYPVFRY